MCGAGLWPENTMYAFERAVGLGSDVLEMDLRSTADGVLVLIHDDTVERTTDGSGLVNNFMLNELKKLDAGYEWTVDEGMTFPYRGQGIVVPTLEELFTAFPDMRMNIEIKEVESSVPVPLCDLIHAHNMTDKVLIGSFYTQPMNEFRQACPEIALSATTNQVATFFILNKLFMKAAFTPTFHAMQLPEYRDNLHILTPEFVDAIRTRNLSTYAWTINDVENMQYMLDLGVNGMVTDYPDKLIELINEK